MKPKQKIFLLLPLVVTLFACVQVSAQTNQLDDLTNGASVFVFRKTLNEPRDAGGQKKGRDAAGNVSQKPKGYQRRRVIKVKKPAPASANNQKTGKPATPVVAEPIAPEDWLNEAADYAIEERKIADDEPLLFLSEGYLNSKIQFCESPLFPDAARRTKIKQVRQKISVTIGKYGGILDAQAMDGDPVFRNAVYRSLESMRFRETYFMGQPVRIQGILEFTQTPANEIVCRVADKAAEIPTVIDGGVLNEYAKSCEVPAFPADVKTANLKSVTAVIQIIVDEKGNVIYASPIESDAKFGEAAKQSALKTTFPISSIIRQPVKVKGIMVFTQTPNNDGSCKSPASVEQ
jgi:hypothetical protein